MHLTQYFSSTHMVSVSEPPGHPCTHVDRGGDNPTGPTSWLLIQPEESTRLVYCDSAIQHAPGAPTSTPPASREETHARGQRAHKHTRPVRETLRPTRHAVCVYPPRQFTLHLGGALAAAARHLSTHSTPFSNILLAHIHTSHTQRSQQQDVPVLCGKPQTAHTKANTPSSPHSMLTHSTSGTPPTHTHRTIGRPHTACKHPKRTPSSRQPAGAQLTPCSGDQQLQQPLSTQPDKPATTLIPLHCMHCRSGQATAAARQGARLPITPMCNVQHHSNERRGDPALQLHGT